jgi:hypothetical protein
MITNEAPEGYLAIRLYWMWHQEGPIQRSCLGFPLMSRNFMRPGTTTACAQFLFRGIPEGSLHAIRP